MRNQLDYGEGGVSDSNFRKHVVSIQKCRRRELLRKWEEEGRDINALVPKDPSIEPQQWSRLLEYWTSKQFDERRVEMKRARNRIYKDERGSNMNNDTDLALSVRSIPARQQSNEQDLEGRADLETLQVSHAMINCNLMLQYFFVQVIYPLHTTDSIELFA
jgi:hypothetical protein